MINAIGSISTQYYNAEYQKIIKELKLRGMRVTGDKSIDRANLQTVKEKEKEAKEVVREKIDIKPEDTDKERHELEELKTGAMNLAEINKILLGL